MGVFATRSPYRPNPIGLSSVKFEGIEQTKEGLVLIVSGVDLRDNTPIYDIKPYLPYVDSHPNARGGFAEEKAEYALEVEFPEELRQGFSREQQEALVGILERDPRPHYHDDPERLYGMSFAGRNVRFRVQGRTALICSVEHEESGEHG